MHASTISFLISHAPVSTALVASTILLIVAIIAQAIPHRSAALAMRFFSGP